MSAISEYGKIIAADGITGLGNIIDYARRTREAGEAFERHQLSKASMLRIARESAEMMLHYIAQNEGIPTVAEFQAEEARIASA